MIGRIRLLVVLARPAVAFLLCVYAAIGEAQAGAVPGGITLVRDLVVVVAFLLFSVTINDISDAPIDRHNLPGSNRPLITGRADERQLTAVAVVAAVAALGAAATCGWPILATTAGGLVLSAGYSLPPLRLAARGALAAVVLPAGYVAVPFLVGLFTVRRAVTLDDALLFAGLYVGFIGRILLKDFRDLRGDALFGKRTFLVRRGRRATCIASAAFWTAGGALIMVATRRPTIGFLACTAVGLVSVVCMLRALARERGHRRDEALISAIAITGRAVLVLLVAQLSMTDQDWKAPAANAALVGISAAMAGAVVSMLRHGPRSNLGVAMKPHEGTRSVRAGSPAVPATTRAAAR